MTTNATAQATIDPHTMKSWDDFWEEYTLVENHLDNNASLDGVMFETYGAELEFVRAQDPKCVWTYISCDDAIVITHGMRLVNRVGYLVTAEPVKDEYVEYVEYVEHYEEDEEDDEEKA